MKRIVASAVTWLVCTSVAISSEPTADDYLNFFKPLIGEWTAKITVGEKAGQGTFSCRLSPTKRCLVWYGASNLPLPNTHSIDGYDPVAKKWKGFAFAADGSHRVTMYQAADADSLKVDKAEFKCEATEAKADGEVVKWRWQTTFILGRDTCKVLYTALADSEGEKAPDVEFIYERKRK